MKKIFYHLHHMLVLKVPTHFGYLFDGEKIFAVFDEFSFHNQFFFEVNLQIAQTIM